MAYIVYGGHIIIAHITFKLFTSKRKLSELPITLYKQTHKQKRKIKDLSYFFQSIQKFLKDLYLTKCSISLLKKLIVHNQPGFSLGTHA